MYRCHLDAIVPKQQTGESVGYDLHALEGFRLGPGERTVVRTGLVVQPPEGYHTEILLRSSLAYKHDIMLINGVGLIDRDYAGPTDELKIMLYRAPKLYADGVGSNARFLGSHKDAVFEAGDRIAQLVLRKTYRYPVVELAQAPSHDRGGLGSTGK